ncbi:MAG: type III pantothenate kinase, partial [Flavobacteriaceae bacterium]|nr:type III pantothenate kinase [Flavobacteriaceae bacterium]
MNLVIDVGNTNIKCAVFKDGVIHRLIRLEPKDFNSGVESLLGQENINKGIISSVGKLDQENHDFLKHYPFIVFLNHDFILPFSNLYSTPSTLGLDRIALAAAAVHKYPSQNVLVIDAGTCVTYDFINSKSEYLGGAISPGLTLRYKSLNNFTANLPLLA